MLKCHYRALEKCLELYRQGHVTPIRPLLTYGAQDATEAFRVLQNRDHIGKVILKMSRDDSILSDVRSASTLALDPGGSYLLAGGLGGLGKAIATWMVEHGARSLIFLSRSAGLNESDQAFFEELKSMGCVISAVAGMTQQMEDVIKAISSAPGPIKGVIQLAMVLRVSHLCPKSRRVILLIQNIGQANRQHEPRRLGHSELAESRRYLEPPQRPGGPTSRFLLHV